MVKRLETIFIWFSVKFFVVVGQFYEFEAYLTQLYTFSQLKQLADVTAILPSVPESMFVMIRQNVVYVTRGKYFYIFLAL